MALQSGFELKKTITQIYITLLNFSLMFQVPNFAGRWNMSFPKSLARVMDLRMSCILDLPWPLMPNKISKDF